MATLGIALLGAGIGAWAAPVGWSFLGMSGASLGWAIGSTLASSLGGGKTLRQEGPRLGDLKVQASTYGLPIPVVYGAMRLSGNMIWSLPILETATTKKYKSGGLFGGGQKVKVTTYTYSQTFAVALCEGEIVGVRKIWANGELIYNVGDNVSPETVAASNQAAVGFSFYTGTETQTADALIQTAVGAANAPAYRGLAYVVFANLQLARFGNRTPNLEFEVVTEGTTQEMAWALAAGNSEAVDVAYGNGVFAAVGYNGSSVGTAYTSPDGITWTARTISDRKWRAVVYGGGQFVAFANSNGGFSPPWTTQVATSPDGLTWTLRTTNEGVHFNGACYGANRYIAVTNSSESSVIFVSYDGITWAGYSGDIPNWYGWNAVAYGNGLFVAVSTQVTSNGSSAIMTSADGMIWTAQTAPSDIYTLNAVAYSGTLFVAAGNNDVLITSPDGIAWTQRTIPTGYEWSDVAYAYGLWVATSYDGVVMTSADGITWALAIAPNSGWDGVAYGAGRFVAVTNGGSGYIMHALWPDGQITSTEPPLASIVTDICERAGLAAGDIDVTDLADTVPGYVVQRASARGQLAPLLQAYFADAVESGGKIKFVTRGGASAATIAEDDLAAHEDGAAVPEPLQRERTQEMELPVEVAVQYPDVNSGYQIGAQSARRMTVSSINKDSFSLSIAMSATKAKQVADVLLYDAWMARSGAAFSTGWKYSWLEPTDVVTVTAGGRSYTLRITDEAAAGGIFTRRAAFEDASVYTQTAEAGELTPPDEDLLPTPATRVELLDIPLLLDQDDGIGFYAAACGVADGWRGAQLYKSTDGGLSWFEYGNGFLGEATIGNATTVLGDFTEDIFDESNTVTVMLQNGEIASDTELNILNGANAALLGDEIIQFREATLIAADTYTLSGLLRGRLGTEWARSTHAIGERFVVFDRTTTYLMEAATAEHNLARLYKAVTADDYLDNTAATSFTHTGVALMPYAPVQLGGGRDAAGNLTLTWVRRSRIAAAWTDYADVPVGEETEAYEVDIYSDGSYATLKRTLTGLASQTAAYSAADQTTDFGSPQSTVYFVAYQLSAVVGRGYAAQGAI